MSKPYKYCPETLTVSNGECTMHVMQDMPEWEGKDLYEDLHFETDLHPNNHNLWVAIPKKTMLHMGGGFHAFITWNGDNGIDQHGREWIDKANPVLKRCAVATAFNNALQEALSLINQQQFMSMTEPASGQEHESFEEMIERRERAEEMADGCEEDFILNWRNGK